LDISRVIAYRQFGNKMWNAAKFALINFPAGYQPTTNLYNNAAAQRWLCLLASFVFSDRRETVHAMLMITKSLPEKWILHRLSMTVANANDAFGRYDFAALTHAIYSFWYSDFCDVYLELSKPTMQSDQNVGENVGKKNAALAVLFMCLHTALRLTHPTMPFLTEELYHRLPGANTRTDPTTDRAACGSIAVATYPKTVWLSEVFLSDPDFTLCSALRALCVSGRVRQVH
jgi:valyl-tRNA synthetase